MVLLIMNDPPLHGGTEIANAAEERRDDYLELEQKR
jgi:hypothetical protein